MADDLKPQKRISKSDRADKQMPNPYRFFYGAFLLGLAITGFVISPYGHVQHVYVEGSEAVPEQGIIDASSISSRQTVAGILWDEERIESDITTAWPKIKVAEVSRRGLNDITLAITEYETIAYLQNENGYRSLLETGKQLSEEIPFPIGNKPILKSFEDIEEETLEELTKQLQALDDGVQNSISEIKWEERESDPPAITVYMNDGNQVRVFVKQLSEKLAYYPAMVSQLEGKKGIIDMEAGAYFVPFAEDEEAATGGDTSNGTDSNQELTEPEEE